MTDTVLPQKKHDCRDILPWQTGGYGSTGKPEGTLMRCMVCRRWWKCVPQYGSLGPVTEWVLIRRYHRRSRKVIRHVEGGRP